MSIGIGSGGCSSGDYWEVKSLEKRIKDLEPDFTDFKIKELYYKNGFTVLRVNYSKCKTFNGDKIIVYLKDIVNDIKNKRKIDPHFLKGTLSPIMRIKPDVYGEMLLEVILSGK